MQNPGGQNDAIKAPQDCGSMAELRAAIDDLDQELVRLLARRQLYIERAAVLKHERDAVRDQARVEEVVAKVLTAAKEAGLSPTIAEPVWRALIEQSIRHELESFDRKA
jgi:isochorismate pyruvate lyase